MTTPGERSDARHGLAAIRNSLAAAVKRLGVLRFEMEQGIVERKDEQAVQADIRKEEMAISGYEFEIARCEKILYGDWAPESPASPERMQEIKRAK